MKTKQKDKQVLKQYAVYYHNNEEFVTPIMTIPYLNEWMENNDALDNYDLDALEIFEVTATRFTIEKTGYTLKTNELYNT